ncbi:hypothetical protein MY924_02250 [Haemophilus influenzae]|nr:hypothetical protein [Haemophilus influenzae]MCK9029410.1 hypothetical protein [Haemophilus influenzae]MCK9082835.1 hypothetical protein [Haemophilus influenzae]MCK9086368.1 hypothetical protein [Haemophilus influenzae]MCK9105979.1 hypothetical protein [Haemophilus influenzae]
MCRCSWSPLYA